MKIRKYLSPDDSGGGTLPPSLADIDKGTGIQSGDGSQKPSDLQQAQQQQQKKDPPADPPAPPAEPVEGLNEDGSLQEGYIKGEDGKVVKDPDYKPAKEGDDGDTDDAGGDDSTDDTDFWEDVDKLHGEELKVEYPEGIDPMSPEGAYHREKAVAGRAMEKFEAHLKATDPRGYAYLLHRQAGGSDEDFFSQKTFSLPEYDAFKDSADVQVRVLKSSLISKGLDDESAQMLVDKAIKENKLFDKADAAYQSAKDQYEKELAAVEKQNQQAESQYRTSVNALNQKLITTVNEGKGLNIMIPDTDKAGFTNFIRDHIEYDKGTGKFLFVQPAGEDFERQLEALYLLYKKGDLKSLIQRQAQTQNRKRLGKVIEKSRQQKPGGDDTSQKPAFVPLGSL